MTTRRRVVLIAVSIGVGIGAFLLVPKPLPEISRQELIAEIRSGAVNAVVITDGRVLTGVSSRRGAFRVTLRAGDKDLLDQLSAFGVTIRFETEPLGLI